MYFNRKNIYERVIIIFLMFLSFHSEAVSQSKLLENANLKLDKYYNIVLNRLNPLDRVRLKKAQYQWITFRELDCGWTEKTVPFSCLIKRTNNRAKELKESVFLDAKGKYLSIE